MLATRARTCHAAARRCQTKLQLLRASRNQSTAFVEADDAATADINPSGHMPRLPPKFRDVSAEAAELEREWVENPRWACALLVSNPCHPCIAHVAFPGYPVPHLGAHGQRQA